MNNSCFDWLIKIDDGVNEFIVNKADWERSSIKKKQNRLLKTISYLGRWLIPDLDDVVMLILGEIATLDDRNIGEGSEEGGEDEISKIIRRRQSRLLKQAPEKKVVGKRTTDGGFVKDRCLANFLYQMIDYHKL